MENLIDAGMILAAKTMVTEGIKCIVSSFMKPGIDKICANESRDYLAIEEHVKKYIEKVYNKNLYMNTIIFKGVRKTIDDLYIPLTVIKHSIKGNDNCYEEILIDEYRDEFIAHYKKVILVDSAGMGKSTIIKFLFQQSVVQKKGIPILIELRKLGKEKKIIDYILNEINGNRECLSKDEVLLLLEEGNFIFFFDGYDEIAPEAKEKVTEDIQDFITKNQESKFIISSREEDELLCFGDFQRFDIRPLKENEAYELIRKYDKSGDISNELIDKLQDDENMKLLGEFLENPLMVSLLYKAYLYKRTIPLKKGEFYIQVYNALYEEHDLSKGSAYKHFKSSKLGRDDFHRILRSIAFVSFKKGIIYSRDELINIIMQAKNKNMDLNFNTSEFIDDLVYSVPLFTKEGIEYRWSHKSFQEYFLAEYIHIDAKENQKNILEKIMSYDNLIKYYNVLDIYYDLDYKGFKNIVIYPILTQFEEFYNSHYTNGYYKKIDSELLIRRKCIEFNYKYALIKKLSKEERVQLRINSEKTQRDTFETLFGNYREDGYSVVLNGMYIGIKYKLNWYQPILRLLYYKKNNLVEMIHRKSPIRENKVMTSDLDDDTASFSEILDDSTDKFINKIENFKYINDILLRIGTRKIFGNIVINCDNYMKLKEGIEKEIDLEKNDLDFI